MRRGGVILVAVVLFLLVVPKFFEDGSNWQDFFFPKSGACAK
ncbi:MAG: hypothetical protein PHX62_01170 [Bacilli bacterium]|nr:hypothetical protein [Bacilli bacterium]